MDNLAKRMKTATDNHIVLNFENRLVRHILLKYHLSSKKEACAIVRECGVYGPKSTQIAYEIIEWLGCPVFR
jgi:hypothetical protein